MGKWPLDPAPVEGDAENARADDASAGGAWAEPRGPHLPDTIHRLAALPLPAWIFVALAIARLSWGLQDAGLGPGFDPWRVVQVLIAETPSVVSILFAAALLSRHRNAWSSGRTLVVGVLLLAGVEGLRVARSLPAAPAAGDVDWSFLAVQASLNLLDALAIATVAGGLVAARRRDDSAASWPVSGILVLLVVLIGIAGIVSISHVPFDQLPSSTSILVALVSTVVLNVLSAGAFGFLTTTLTAGVRAGEAPPWGWRSAAIGSWLVIGSLAALAAVGLEATTPESQALIGNIAQALEGTFALGYLGLLAGFVLGLPAVARRGDLDDGVGEFGVGDLPDEDEPTLPARRG